MVASDSRPQHRYLEDSLKPETLKTTDIYHSWKEKKKTGGGGKSSASAASQDEELHP
jgi:hypothetical protein